MAKRTPGQPAQYQRAYRERQKAGGLCTSCGNTPALPGKTKCERHLAVIASWWKNNPEYGRGNQRKVRERRVARSHDEVLADRARLRPDGLKWCKRRAAHAAPLPFDEFFAAMDQADGLYPVCRACNRVRYRRQAERHWRAAGIPFECAYCGGPYEHVDHAIPLRLGGTDEVANLVPSCAQCNQSKTRRPLAEWLAARSTA